MAEDVFSKQPYETFPISMDFVNRIRSGDSIIGGNIEVKAFDETGEEDVSVLTGVASLSGTKISQRVQAGAGGKQYVVRFRTGATVLSDKWEWDVTMRIQDSPKSF